MSWKLLVKSVNKGEVLLPVLRAFLAEEKAKINRKELTHTEVVQEDARLTIKTFEERIEEYNHREHEGDFFHPSQLGQCARALWFKHFKAPKSKGAIPQNEDPFREFLIFETGTYVGVLLQNLCERAGVLRKREVPIKSESLKIIGHADGDLEIAGVKYILELKTINSRNFKELSKGPKEAHLRQVHAYMKALDRQWTIIIYLEKDRHEVKEFVVPFNPAFYAKHVRNRIDKHFENIKTKSLPDKEGDSPNRFPCTWCPYTHVCFGTSELRAFMNTLAVKRKLKLPPMLRR